MARREAEPKRLTIEDIAQALGVSKSTVSRAMSGKGRIGEVTRNRVQQYIKAHDYKPNSIAKSLAQSKTYNIGVVLPSDPNLVEIPFFQNCLMGISEVATSLEYDVLVIWATGNDITLLKRIIDQHKVDGIILTRGLVNDMAINYLKQIGFPFVLIGSNEDETIAQVDHDHETGCFELTSILIRSGLGPIGLISGDQSFEVNAKRYKGFVKAFERNGLGVNESLVFLNETNKALVEMAVDKLLEGGAKCLVCADDLICSKVMTKLEAEKYLVPEQVKVASFYDSAYLANHNPPITALHIDTKALGEEAGRCMINLINKEAIKTKSLLDYEINLKKSTM